MKKESEPRRDETEPAPVKKLKVVKRDELWRFRGGVAGSVETPPK